MKNLLALLGRIAFSAIFIMAGISKIMDFSQTAALMASNGLPYSQILLILAIIVELGGGLMILTGWKAKWGAFLLFLFVIPVTFVFHSFWNYEPEMAINQMQHFLKNLSIIGGTLYIIAFGPGRFSLGRSRPKST